MKTVTDSRVFGRTGTRANALNGIRPRCALGHGWPGRAQQDARGLAMDGKSEVHP